MFHPPQAAEHQLADALACEVELGGDPCERRLLAVEPEPQLEDEPLTLRERAQRRPYLLRCERCRRLLERLGRLRILEQVRELAVVVLTDGLVQRRGYVCRCQRLLDLPAREPGGLGELVLGRTAPELGFEPVRLARKPLLPRDDVNRQPDRPALCRDRALHRLADPPDGVGGELVATAPVELLDRAGQAERALLDQIEERQAASLGTLVDRDDPPKGRLDHPPPRPRVGAL